MEKSAIGLEPASVIGSADLFLCERRQLRLTRPGCARLYRAASGPRAPDPWQGLAGCRKCPLGALHATGRAVHPVTALTEALRPICARCGRTSDRLIWGMYCPSCDARQREAVNRRNAKGHPPALSALLHTQTIAQCNAGETRLLRRTSVVSLVEVMLHAARGAQGPLGFGRRRLNWPGLIRVRGAWAAQLDLGL